MPRPVQKRTLETRAKLIAAAEALIDAHGFEALRVEEVVLKAGVAKGTFFAHFRDKDALMDRIVAARIDAHLDRIETSPRPETVAELIAAWRPLVRFMASERYVFDLIMRYSGATAREEIGPIAMTFERQADVLAEWLTDAPFRRDVSPELLAEGVQAFNIQAVALNFCALHSAEAMDARLESYLTAWLTPADPARHAPPGSAPHNPP